MQRLPTPRIGLLLGLLAALFVGPNGCGGGDAATADNGGQALGGETDAPAAPDSSTTGGEEDAATDDTPAPDVVAPGPESDVVDPAEVMPEEPSVEWPVGECTDQPAGTGVKVGDVAMDFEMMDQYGQMVRLHDFCDKTILLVGSAFWCPGCIDKAPTLDAIYQSHKDNGLLIITLLTETLDNEPCTQADLKLWADEYGQSFPVLSDVDGYIHTFTPKEGGKLPMEILTVIDDITEQNLIEILP